MIDTDDGRFMSLACGIRCSSLKLLNADEPKLPFSKRLNGESFVKPPSLARPTYNAHEEGQVGLFERLAAPDIDWLFLPTSRTGVPSGWYAHVPFARWIVAAARPLLLVELGTHNGVSYSAFCDAVKRELLPTSCYAVDTWKGDAHAGFYGEDIFENFRAFHDQNYFDFSALLRMTFDEALANFSDGSIDLLHIDGFHSYEAAREDFEKWRPKLSNKAIVLFHDTNVRDQGFGVWKLWAELRANHPGFEFLHGHGLGVLQIGDAVPPPVAALCALEDQQRIGLIRQRFAVAGQRCVWEDEVIEQKAGSELPAAHDEARRATEALAEAGQYARHLEAELARRDRDLGEVRLQHNTASDEARRATEALAEAGQYARHLEAELARRDRDLGEVRLASMPQPSQTIAEFSGRCSGALKSSWNKIALLSTPSVAQSRS